MATATREPTVITLSIPNKIPLMDLQHVAAEVGTTTSHGKQTITKDPNNRDTKTAGVTINNSKCARVESYEASVHLSTSQSKLTIWTTSRSIRCRSDVPTPLRIITSNGLTTATIITTRSNMSMRAWGLLKDHEAMAPCGACELVAESSA